MPYSITTKDGITVNNIPDDVPADSPDLKARVAAIRAGGGTAALETSLAPAPVVAPAASPEEPPKTQTTLQGLTGAVTRGLAPVVGGATLGAIAGAPFAGVGAIPGAIAGAGAATLATTLGDPIVGSINSLFGTKYTLPTDALTDLLTRVGVAEPKTTAERIVQTTTAGAAGAGGMAAAGKAVEMAAGVAKPMTQAVGAQLAAKPLAQVAGGAGAGLAGQTAKEMGAGPVGQIAASIAGGVTGAKLATTKIQPTATQLPSDIADAERAGVTLMTTDVVPPRTFASKWLQTVGERIPLAGTGGVRQTQQAERIEAVRNVLRDFGADDAARASDDVMKDLATKRGTDLSKYSGAKTEVIERLGQTGTVPMTNTVQAIDDQISKLQGLKTQEVAPIIERLTDWKTALQGQNLVNVETLRKQIGESFKAPELASVRGIGEKALSSIYKPLKQDMEAFITQVGERRDVTKYKVANKRLADLAGELDMSTLKSVLRSGDATPEVVGNMLFSKKPSEVSQLYASLTPAGRESARAAILARAAEKATAEVAEGTVVSPDKFANEVKRLGTSIGVFFSGDDLKQVEGLTRVLNITKRASEAAATPPTGVQTAIPVGAAALSSFFGGGLPGFLATLGTAGGVGVAARIYESAPIRNLLIKIPQTISGSPEEAALLKRLTATIQQQQQAQSTQENP
jgi:hypothetical protein